MQRTFPILLCHGIAPFDVAHSTILRLDKHEALDNLHYFKNIKYFLRSNGFAVENSRVSFARSVDERAKELRDNVIEVMKKYNVNKVHLLCHSMGGLDARRLLFNYRDEAFYIHIASITTLSTPHWGAEAVRYYLLDSILGLQFRNALKGALKFPENEQYAKRTMQIMSLKSDYYKNDTKEERDVVAKEETSDEQQLLTLSNASSSSVQQSSQPYPNNIPYHTTREFPFNLRTLPHIKHPIRLLWINIEGLIDLLPEVCAEYNRISADFEANCGVKFITVAAQREFSASLFVFRLTVKDMIQHEEGDNDGYVSVKSAMWRPEYFRPPVLDQDHMSLLGWSTQAATEHGYGTAEEQENKMKEFYLTLCTELETAFPIAPQHLGLLNIGSGSRTDLKIEKE
ncbi:MAG: triacylglycerol lipase [Streblomastix strix]|uniref:Triacylglycerol lipase n=1 Tax=Streblomastix strix TaxID=222440 RepID=A0A5J4VNM1_9EUKA|nr:MAG: triacylglycerol lipase [Streblomastix strix]